MPIPDHRVLRLAANAVRILAADAVEKAGNGVHAHGCLSRATLAVVWEE